MCGERKGKWGHKEDLRRYRRFVITRKKSVITKRQFVGKPKRIGAAETAPVQSAQVAGSGEAVVDSLAGLHQSFDGVDGFVEHRLFVLVHLDFHDAFDAACADDRRDADIETVETVGPVNKRAARNEIIARPGDFSLGGLVSGLNGPT